MTFKIDICWRFDEGAVLDPAWHIIQMVCLIGVVVCIFDREILNITFYLNISYEE